MEYVTIVKIICKTQEDKISFLREGGLLMLCKECKNKPIARGVKKIKCLHYKTNGITNCEYINLCNTCSYMIRKCQRCGADIERKNNTI